MTKDTNGIMLMRAEISRLNAEADEFELRSQNLRDQAKRVESALAVLLEIYGKADKTHDTLVKPIDIPTKVRSKFSVEDKILSLFIDKTPRTSRQLMELFNKNSDKQIGLQDFSGRLGKILKKGSIKKETFEENSTAYKFFYGLPAWFDGEKLKTEYRERIKKGSNNI